MRAPEGGTLAGWFAMKIMEKGNPPSIRHGMAQLQLQPSDTLVELGPGHGYGLRVAYEIGVGKYIGIEISPSFRQQLEEVKKELQQQRQECAADAASTISIHGDDAKDMSEFLDDASVDKMFGMNVVYFLDPLEEYLHEFHRVLVPGGTLVFGCKFQSVKDAQHPFVNTVEEPIVARMKHAGFEVTSTKVDLGDPAINYVAIKGVKASK